MKLVHLSRLSDDPEILHFARRTNSNFLRSGITELSKLDSECEAVYLRDGTRVACIVVFYRLEDNDGIEYYMPIVWTHPDHRDRGLYARLLDWLKDYATGKGAHRLSADVHASNGVMLRLMERHWDKTFVRFNLAL